MKAFDTFWFNTFPSVRLNQLKQDRSQFLLWGLWQLQALRFCPHRHNEIFIAALVNFPWLLHVIAFQKKYLMVELNKCPFVLGFLHCFFLE